MLLGFLEGFGLGVSEEEGERGRFDIWFAKWWGWSLVKLVLGRERRGYFDCGLRVLKTFLVLRVIDTVVGRSEAETH